MMEAKPKTPRCLLTLLSTLFMFITFTACEEDSTDAYLYPDFIEFEAKGGTQKVKVDKQKYKSYGLDYVSYKDYYFIDEEDKGWLDVKENNDGTYTITAKSNTTPDKREAAVRFWFSHNENQEYKGGDPLSVRVIQKGNSDTSIKTDMIESVNVNACVICGKFLSSNTGKEVEAQIGGGFWFDNNDRYSFTQQTTVDGDRLHVELNGKANERTAYLLFNINNFNNLEAGVSTLNVKYNLETPSKDEQIYVAVNNIPVTEILDNKVHAEGWVKDGVKFIDLIYSSPQSSLIEPYFDSQYNHISIYIEFNK